MIKFKGTIDDLKNNGFKHCPVSPFNSVCLMLPGCTALYVMPNSSETVGLLVNADTMQTIARSIKGRKDDLINENEKILKIADSMRLKEWFVEVKEGAK